MCWINHKGTQILVVLMVITCTSSHESFAKMLVEENTPDSTDSIVTGVSGHQDNHLVTGFSVSWGVARKNHKSHN